MSLISDISNTFFKKEHKTEENKDKNVFEKDYVKNIGFESFKSDTIDEFNKKVNALMSEHKIWLEQYQRNMKNTIENYERRTNDFEAKINIVRETLEKNIDNKKEVIESLSKIINFDKVIKYQTSGLIDIPNELGDLRALDDGNWEVIILAKKIDKNKGE